VRGTEGYADEVDALVRQYESIPFADMHRPQMHLLPAAPADVLDIGAGTGRDAAGFAALGYRVTAVEPTAAMREAARALHPEPGIAWIDDGLPELASLTGVFDVVMLTAVWMHLDAAERRAAMARVAALVKPGGVMMLSLRHGPVPAGRRMFDVTADETVALAAAHGLAAVLNEGARDGLQRRPGVSWTRLAFRKAL